jgi:hypothetical protein
VEAGAAFLIVIAAIVIAIGAVLLFGVMAKLRHDKLHPERDKVEQPESEDATPSTRPRHVRVRGEERSRFVHR